MNKILSIRSFILITILFFIPNKEVKADISGLMPGSLPYVSSGNYTWSTWDYLSTPYIYPLLKENAVSSIFTDEFFGNSPNLAFAGKYTISLPNFNIPIFLAIALESEASNTEKLDASSNSDSANKTEINNPYHRFVFGTTLFNDFGIGAIIQVGRGFTEEESGTGETSKIYATIINRETFQKRFDGYGLEFGYINGANPSEGFAFTGSILYKRYGAKNIIENQDGKTVSVDDAPFLRQEGGISGESHLKAGPKRDEFFFSLLGWYHITKELNLGGNFNFFVPFGSGFKAEDTQEGGKVELTPQFLEERERDEKITVSGYFVNPTIFIDNDFALLDALNGMIAGYFRLSPSLEGIFHKETLESATLGSYGFDFTSIRLNLHFKLAVAMGKNKLFELYVGWLPYITLYEQRNKKQVIRSPETGEETINEGLKEIKFGRFPVGPAEDQYTLGFSVRPYSGLEIHFNMISQTSFINLGRINLGVDYRF